MVGEGVLLECLQNPDVETVFTVTRKPGGVSHQKLKEIICTDFFDLKTIEKNLNGYGACFFCLGVSSIGMKEPEYTRLTYTLTMNFAETLVRYNKEMTFCYLRRKYRQHGKRKSNVGEGKGQNRKRPRQTTF